MKRIFLLFFVCILFVASCAPATSIVTATNSLTPSQTPNPSRTPLPPWTPKPSIAPSPTLIPSSTSTSQPPLIAHEWRPGKVLISYVWGSGDGCCTFPQTPRLILYSDGTLFLTRYYQINHVYRSRILIKKLSQQKVCQNLNTFDQIGFLDYDPSTYVFNEEPALEGGGSTAITIDAWKFMYVAFDSLGSYIHLQSQVGGNGKGFPAILPALRSAFLFLDEYPIDGFEVYRPEKFGIWVMPAYDDQDPPNEINGILVGEWSLKNLSLSKMYSGNNSLVPNGNPVRYTTISGVEGSELYNLLSESFDGNGDTFYEKQHDGSKKYFYVFMRPLLSYEKSNADQTDFAAKNFTSPIDSLSCKPTDGIMLIPTLSNP